MNEARLQEAYQRALAERDDGTRASCPSLESIDALARGTTAESERLDTLTHVMSCRRCQQELDLLRAIQSAGVISGAVAARREVRSLPWRVIVPVALAASLVIAAFIGVQNRLGRGPITDTPRGDATGLVLVAPNDAAEVAASAPLAFTWRADSAARRYVVEVLTQKGEVIVSRTTSDTTITLPDTSGLAPSTDYQWWVRSITPAGQRASAMRRFRTRSP